MLWIGYPGRKGEHLDDWASSSVLPDKRKDESEAQAAVGEEAAAPHIGQGTGVWVIFVVWTLFMICLRSDNACFCLAPFGLRVVCLMWLFRAVVSFQQLSTKPEV